MLQFQTRGGFPRVFVLACFSLVLFLLDRGQFIYIFNEQSCLVGTIALKENFFLHTYVHSINKTQVVEKILVQHSYFRIIESRFKDYSTGIDSSEAAGFTYDGSWFILKLNRETSCIRIAVSPIPDHTLVVQKHRYPLTYFSKINTILLITGNLSLHTH